MASGWKFDNSYARLPERFYAKVRPVVVADPQLVIFNQGLAEELGLSDDEVRRAEFLAGNMLAEGAEPLAQAYAGHQFGHFNLLGDGRAHLIGEHIAPNGKRYDIQLKGSGQTPYSRQGDGRAALGPMLREYILSEAFHALGIPTTRSLAVATTGETIVREESLTGAVLMRVAASHIRVGTFEFFAAREDLEGVKILADYAIERHYPELLDRERPYLAFLQAVIARQARLVAQWMGVGFIHGVMNTDNMAISGETIDYGPCAFMDAYDPATVFSSIDRHGRYAFGNQPVMAQWNLARFAETLLPLLADGIEEAVALAEKEIGRFTEIFEREWLAVMRRKLGLFGEEAGDRGLVQSLLDWMEKTGADYTLTFRKLSSEEVLAEPLFQSEDFLSWHAGWTARVERNGEPLQASRELMRGNNPAVIPRNYLVERALRDAEDGDLRTTHRLLDALKKPFDEGADYADLRELPPASDGSYRTFCGT